MYINRLRHALLEYDNIFLHSLGYNFTSNSIDDSLWWGLAWIRAFDLTGDHKYLEMSAFIADYIYQFHDDICGGGIYLQKCQY